MDEVYGSFYVGGLKINQNTEFLDNVNEKVWVHWLYLFNKNDYIPFWLKRKVKIKCQPKWNFPLLLIHLKVTDTVTYEICNQYLSYSYQVFT